MQIEFNKVTWYSKIISAIVLLGALPILVFFIGREYEKTMGVLNEENKAAVTNISATPRVYSHRESNISVVVYSSGIEGLVTVGPSCPVITQGNEEECADKPLATDLKFINQYGASTTTSSKADGTFVVSLAPGTYTVQQGGEALLPSLVPKTVIVNNDEYTYIELSFDSGIR